MKLIKRSVIGLFVFGEADEKRAQVGDCLSFFFFFFFFWAPLYVYTFNFKVFEPRPQMEMRVRGASFNQRRVIESNGTIVEIFHGLGPSNLSVSFYLINYLHVKLEFFSGGGLEKNVMSV